MNIRRIILRVALCVPLCALAQTPDPLWIKAVAQSHEMKRWVADDVETTMESTGEAPVKTVSHIVSWDKSEPVYSLVQISPDPGTSKEKLPPPADFERFMSMVNQPLKADTIVTRADNQKLDGELWTLFTSETKKFGGSKMIQAWVDPASGKLHRLDSSFHMTLVADVKAVNLYSVDQQGRCLQKQMEMTIDSHGNKMLLKRTPNKWLESPTF
jgi:hypothetical protein